MSSKPGTTKRSRTASSKPAPAKSGGRSGSGSRSGGADARRAPARRGPRVPRLSTPVIVLLLASSMVVGLLVARGGKLLPTSWQRPATVHRAGHIIGAEPATHAAQRESAELPTDRDQPRPASQPKPPTKAQPKADPARPAAAEERAPAKSRVAGVLSPQERRARLAHISLPAGFTTEWQGGPAVLRTAANEVVAGDSGGQRVALTFDGHYPEPALAKLLSLLAERDLRVTFFLTGAFARSAPDSVKQIAAAGHEIANHSDTHPAFTKLSDSGCLAELERAEQYLLPLAGVAYRPYWRPPLGDRNLRVLRVAIRHGFLPVYWTVDTLDWQETATAESVRERITAQGLRAGAIVLQHAGSAASVECLPSEVALFRAKGLVPCSLSELLK